MDPLSLAAGAAGASGSDALASRLGPRAAMRSTAAIRSAGRIGFDR